MNSAFFIILKLFMENNWGLFENTNSFFENTLSLILILENFFLVYIANKLQEKVNQTCVRKQGEERFF